MCPQNTPKTAKKTNELILKNSKLAEIPGVNPIVFKSLEEYTEFIDWQNIPARKGQDLHDAVKPFSHIILKLLTDTNLDMWDKIPLMDKPLSKIKGV